MKFAIVDLDGTLISNSLEVYKKQLGLDINDKDIEKIADFLKILKDKKLSDILKLKDYFDYNEELINLLYDKKKEKYILVLITDNPGGEYFAPPDLFDEIYLTIYLEVKEGVITENISKKSTKKEIVKNILRNKSRIEIIEVYMDGSNSDYDMIKYIRDFYGNILKVYKIS